MKPSERHLIVLELAWHCKDPRAAEKLLTDPERRDILKRGFLTKELAAELKGRIPHGG